MATAGAWTTLRPPLHPTLSETLSNTLALPTMTPVQAAAIPPLLTSKDVCVDAETGSGKTLSYLVPVAQTLLFTLRARPSAAVRALIIAPTRELATQVHAVADALFARLPGRLTPVALIGGGPDAAPHAASRTDLRVVVATPGRLAAALAQRVLNVAKLEMLVLDEADRLLDMGFAVALTEILTRLPRQRRTGIYSATQTAEVDALARAGLRNPVRVAVRVAAKEEGEPAGAAKRRRTPASLRCLYHVVPPGDKLAHLAGLLARNPQHKFIVYFLTCACVDYFRRLPLLSMVHQCAEAGTGAGAGAGIATEAGARAERKFLALHGKMSQGKRERALTQFASSANGVLLCTDVAARGIDIPDVDWVLQFDPPQDPDAYIHRVGRTARLGREGNALLYLSPSEDAYADFLQVRRCPVTKMEADELSGASGAGEHVEAGSAGSSEAAQSEKQIVRDMIRQATLADRAILEASEAAFLSYIRAYKEHKCRYLLKLEEVDINSIADSFGLLRLPRFYEFRRLKSKIVSRKDESINIRDIAFKDKAREKRRQGLIKEALANRVERREALQAKSKKVKKRRRKGEDREGGKSRGGKAKRPEPDQLDAEYEEDDFSLEAMQLRKLKRGKLSHNDFDKAAGYGDVLGD